MSDPFQKDAFKEKGVEPKLSDMAEHGVKGVEELHPDAVYETMLEGVHHHYGHLMLEGPGIERDMVDAAVIACPGI